MLGLLLIYFVGKAFYDLAAKSQKSKWGYAILGVVSYHAGTVLIALIIVLMSLVEVIGSFDDIPDFAFNLLVIPFGVLTCWLFYKFLQKRWTRQALSPLNEEVLDSGL